MYAIPKLHKDPISFRYIAGTCMDRPPVTDEPLPVTRLSIEQQLQQAYNRPPAKPKNSTTDASTFLSRKLQQIITILQDKDEEFIQLMVHAATG